MTRKVHLEASILIACIMSWCTELCQVVTAAMKREGLTNLSLMPFLLISQLAYVKGPGYFAEDHVRSTTDSPLPQDLSDPTSEMSRHAYEMLHAESSPPPPSFISRRLQKLADMTHFYERQLARLMSFWRLGEDDEVEDGADSSTGS
ncbi:hypothetical protein HAX54_038315 [Datura stramonium]|uniref:Uncharacterized protein n=1 Tax=Datura stramonium TaxID=4076 RepID=A0ABS8VL28_DATST|nr:hypothetical protein [Datura stramonium]